MYELPNHLDSPQLIGVDLSESERFLAKEGNSYDIRLARTKVLEELRCEFNNQSLPSNVISLATKKKSGDNHHLRIDHFSSDNVGQYNCSLRQYKKETRWSCSKSRDMGRNFKAALCGSPRSTSGVGIIVSERFRDSIVSVERFNDRLMKIVVAAKERLYHFFSAYAPQSGCSDQAKEEFWNLLDEKTAEVPSKDVNIVAGDLNGLEYAESHSLTIVSTIFRKRVSHLISCYSRSSNSQIDLVLVKDRDRSIVRDAKVVPYETIAPHSIGR
ncbi:unnamed protein product [Heligmosomoides polygyrus]|uniref:Endo/exonuclease/phosphatase domain-containing protein n=1 Tax=Heligmosomoides polygyrus TaxID=6339 RepID=A0A183GFL0_HELPZ|nr:unnamed protein product [Heligmosomoides polygyrus]